MRFRPDSHPGRHRSTSSTAALGRPSSSRTVFIYSSNAGYARGTLRGLLDGGLRTFTGDNDAKMYYTAETFRALVFFRFLAKLLGWPDDIPFCNLSGRGAPSQSQIRELISLAERGILRFEAATPEEVEAAQLDVAYAVPGPLFRPPLPAVARRDIGSRKPRFDANGEVVPPRHERNGPKSAAWIGEETEDADSAEPVGLRPITMWKDQFLCVLERGSWTLSSAGGSSGGDSEDPIEEWDAPCMPCEWCMRIGATCLHNVVA